VTELRTATLLDTLHHLDAFRRPQRLEQFLLACEADFRGRLGYAEQPYPQADYFRRAFAAASQVEVATLLAEGFNGIKIKEELQRRRLHVLNQLKNLSANSSLTSTS
jgi:tRNA nucleotidyltransferase (CCA-adding enzyme)